MEDQQNIIVGPTSNRRKSLSITFHEETKEADIEQALHLLKRWAEEGLSRLSIEG